jgi:hypothetical protein
MYEATTFDLRRLRQRDCRFRALLKFARLPYVSRRSASASPPRIIAGDLRYDRNPDRDFSDIPLPLDPSKGSCPRFVPGWQEPRAELFRR